MNAQALAGNRIPAMTPETVGMIYALEAAMRELPQVDIETHHVLHGGVYSRTIRIPAGVRLTGALIKVPTTLTINGHAKVVIGNELVELQGHHVLAASAGRKQALQALTDTFLTMSFSTSAKTIEEAENELTDEAHLMFSRNPDAVNHITITGE